MNFSALKDFAIIVGGLVTIFAFINGTLEYRRQGTQKRVEHFTMLRRRLKENPVFKEICSLLLILIPAHWSRLLFPIQMAGEQNILKNIRKQEWNSALLNCPDGLKLQHWQKKRLWLFCHCGQSAAFQQRWTDRT